MRECPFSNNIYRYFIAIKKKQRTNSSSFNVARCTADVKPAFLFVAAIVYTARTNCFKIHIK